MPLGVYLSRFDGAIDGIIDTDEALRGVKSEAAVMRVVSDLFDAETAERMVRDVIDADLDAVVLAGNSPEHYRRSISAGYVLDRLAEAGVNPNRIVAANILEQVAHPHASDPAAATAKAKAIIEVAALRATMADPIDAISIEPRRSVMILGFTAEAAVAAQRLLRLGYKVIIVDREDGVVRRNRATAMHATTSYVLGHPSAEIVNNAKMIDGEGWLGDYHMTIESPSGTSTYRVGGILLARPDAADWVDWLRQHFRVDIDDQGWARSLDPMTHPADTVDPGLMVIPPRRTDALERDKVAAADAAAMALVLRLSQPHATRFRDVSHVDRALCGGCASCVRTCAFGACHLDDEGFSYVDERRCRACGKCVVGCPVGARDIVSSPHDYLLEAVRHLAAVKSQGPKVLGFLCGGCGYPAADNAGRTAASEDHTYPTSFLPVQIPCGGRLDALYVLEAFKQGFDGVCVYRCREGHCHNLIGNVDMDRRLNLLRTILKSRGIDDARLRIIDISPSEGERFIESVNEVFSTLNTLSAKEGGAR